MSHLGADRVVDLARSRFYWPYMQEEIEYFSANQCRCIQQKKPQIPPEAPMESITTTAPFEMVTIDFLQFSPEFSKQDCVTSKMVIFQCLQILCSVVRHTATLL